MERQQKRNVPPSELKKKREKMKEMPKVKITGTASTKPRVSASMSKSQPKTIAKTTPKPKPKVTTKPKPMETTRVGGIFNVPKKPKKTVY
jgi:hypothetical protein